MLHKKLPNCTFGNIFDISAHVKIPIIAYPHTLKYLSKHNFDISAHVKVPIMTYPHVLKLPIKHIRTWPAYLVIFLNK